MATVRQTIPAEDSSTAVPSAEALVAARTALSPPTDERSIEDRIEALLKQAKANRPSEDISLIRKAWEFCVSHHKGQTRASGEPYIVHPLEVAEVLVEMKLDATAVAAALLHDAVEDTPATSEEIGDKFGDQVAHICRAASIHG